jgi:hypothetical protein
MMGAAEWGPMPRCGHKRIQPIRPEIKLKNNPNEKSGCRIVFKWRRSRREFLDAFPDPVAVVHHFLIGKSDHANAMALDDLIPQLVIVLLGLVYPAVDLDDQAYLITVKIGNESMDHLLPAEVQPIELILPDHVPEAFLGVCHVPAKRFRKC